MPSNALSQKSFSTKTPVICHPPPWPPFLPPPPVPKTTFYVGIQYHKSRSMFPIAMAGPVILKCEAWNNRYYGWALISGEDNWAEVEIWSIYSFPTYRLQLTLHWYPFFIDIFDWQNQRFPDERPYVAERLSKSYFSGGIIAHATAREIPH